MRLGVVQVYRLKSSEGPWSSGTEVTLADGKTLHDLAAGYVGPVEVITRGGTDRFTTMSTNLILRRYRERDA